MIQIRNGVFETNSSSTHSISITTEENYDAWLKGLIKYNEWEDSFTTAVELTDKEKEACKEYKEEERKAEEIHSSGPEVAANLPETSCNSLLLTIDEITGKLFHASFAGNGEKEYFNTIKGKSVSWKGVLQSAYEYSSDFLFGSGGGVKAKFLLMEYKQEGSFLTRKIYAVVRFPREKSEFLI